MRRTTALLLGGVLAGLAAAGSAAAGDAPARTPLRFLYVEGSVGGATAGHTAVRVHDAVFHHQHDGDVFRMVRDGWSRFQLEYGGFQNRPIHVVSRNVDAADAAALHEHLAAVHLRMLVDLGRREAARRDRGLLESWWAGETRVAVPLAGYFDPAGPPLETEPLRDALGGAARLAPAWERARAERDRALRTFARTGAVAGGPARLRQHIARTHALELLLHARPLAADATLDLHALAPEAVPPLAASERARLEQLAAGLADRVEALVAAADPGQAEALLLAVARHRAAMASLRSGRLLVLDATPRGEAHARLSRSARAEYAVATQVAARAAADARHALLSASAPLEMDWNALEDVAARAARRGRGLAGARHRWIPDRPGSVAVAFPPAGHALRAARDAAVARERRVSAAVSEALGYDLTTRNCVTELLADVQQGLGGRARADAILGGPLRADGVLGYAPLFFHRAAASLPDVRVERIASYREEALAHESARRQPLVVALRESNVVTSKLYRPRDADGSFLLFTSGRHPAGVVLRPLLGLANVGLGVGDALLGVVAAPLDRGDRLLRGLRGAFFSLPELAFVNVRKGSFDRRTLAPGQYPAAPTASPPE